VERLALEIRSLARVGETDVLSAETIARRLTGPVIYHPIVSTRGMLSIVDSQPRIIANPRARDLNFVVAHELGHYALRYVLKWSGPIDEEEELANRIGPAIIAPQELLRRAFAWFGAEKIAPVAKLFRMTQTSTVLRRAEAEREERAIVTVNRNVIVRSYGGYAWAAAPVVSAWASGRPPKGLRKVRLTGAFDRGRVALSA
jgi:hypothetical protein